MKKAKSKSTSSVKNNADFLRVWVKHGKKRGDIRKLIDLASREEIDACAEIFYNAMRGNIRLTSAQVKQLSKYRTQCNQLLSKTVSLPRKKRILKGQVGGFLLPLISSLAAPLLGSIVKGITGRR